MKITPEEAERMARKAEALEAEAEREGINVSVLAGRPPHLRVQELALEHERHQARNQDASVSASRRAFGARDLPCELLRPIRRVPLHALFDGVHDRGCVSHETFPVALLDELAQWKLPARGARELLKGAGLHAELPRHLDLRVTQVVELPRFDPRLPLLLRRSNGHARRYIDASPRSSRDPFQSVPCYRVFFFEAFFFLAAVFFAVFGFADLSAA